jgi:hypothetical protein
VRRGGRGADGRDGVSVPGSLSIRAVGMLTRSTLSESAARSGQCCEIVR